MGDGTLLVRETHIGFQGIHRRLLRSTPEGEAQQRRPHALAIGVFYFYFLSFCPGACANLMSVQSKFPNAWCVHGNHGLTINGQGIISSDQGRHGTKVHAERVSRSQGALINLRYKEANCLRGGPSDIVIMQRA
jgi:hypothetical protein